MVTVSLILAIIALLLAVFSFVPVAAGYPLLQVAVMLLAIAVIV